VNFLPQKNKNQLMAGTIGIALLAVVGWSASELADSRAEESAARQELVDCQERITRIESLRQRPAIAGAATIGIAALSQRIEQAALLANFAQGSILRIEPQTARRVGDTNYLEVPTQLQLRQLTLEQVSTFLHAVCSQSGLNLRDIRLSAPRGQETGDRWTVEATLIDTLYSPMAGHESINAMNVAAEVK